MREAVLAAASATCPLYLWDLTTAAEVCKYSELGVSTSSLCRLGKSLFAGSNAQDGSKEVQTWDFGRAQPVCKSNVPERVCALSGSHSGTYLAGGGHSGAIYVWEVASGRLLRSWPGHYKAVTCLAFTDDDSTLISGGEDANVATWSLVWILRRAASRGEGKEAAVAPSCVWSEHRQAVTSVGCSGSANMVVVSSSLDHTCKIWSLPLRALLQSVVFPFAVNAAALDPGEHALYAGGSDGRIYITALAAAAESRTLLSAEDARPLRDDALCGHRGPVTALAFSSDGVTLVSGSEDHTVRVWDVTAKQLLRTIAHEGPVSCLVVLPLPRLLPQRQLAASRHGRSGQALPKGLPSAQLAAKLAKAPEAEGEAMAAAAPVALWQRPISGKQVSQLASLAFASRIDDDMALGTWSGPRLDDDARQTVRVAWDLYRFCADELLSFSVANGD